MSNQAATFATTDLVKEARNWAAAVEAAQAGYDPLVAFDLNPIEDAKSALERVGVLLFHLLTESAYLAEEVALGHPLVDGLVALYGHKTHGIALRKRLGARAIRLEQDPKFDVPRAVMHLADAEDIPYSADAVLGALAAHLQQTAATLPYSPGVGFLNQFAGSGSGAQRALAVAAALEAKGYL